ncbi:hypothetical protein EVA_09584 [gut metagenome]|uniref:Uncharacterized protein n=1 Tax=gut metagenome TaxID=749906 RepID=J9CQ97_9ZZZZ
MTSVVRRSGVRAMSPTVPVTPCLTLFLTVSSPNRFRSLNVLKL